MVVESIVASSLGVDEMGLVVFVPADSAGDRVPGLQRAVDQDRKVVDHIVRQAVGSVENVLVIVLDFKLSSAHLEHAVVDSLVGGQSSLEGDMLKQQQGAARLGVFVAAADVGEHSQVDSGGHGDGLGQHGHSVGQAGRLVS